MGNVLSTWLRWERPETVTSQQTNNPVILQGTRNEDDLLRRRRRPTTLKEENHGSKYCRHDAINSNIIGCYYKEAEISRREERSRSRELSVFQE